MMAYLVAQVLLVLAAAITLGALHPWRLTQNPLLSAGFAILTVALAAGIMYYEAAGVLRLVQYRADRESVTLDRPLMAAIVGVALLAVLASGAVGAAQMASNRVRNGSEIAFFGVRIERVAFFSATSGIELPSNLVDRQCTFLLGVRGDSFAVFNIKTSSMIIVNGQTVVAQKPPHTAACHLSQP
jgi:hypothetical protein